MPDQDIALFSGQLNRLWLTGMTECHGTGTTGSVPASPPEWQPFIPDDINQEGTGGHGQCARGRQT